MWLSSDFFARTASIAILNSCSQCLFSSSPSHFSWLFAINYSVWPPVIFRSLYMLPRLNRTASASIRQFWETFAKQLLRCIFWVCVCNFIYCARTAHASYHSHLWPVWLYHIFSTLSYKGHDFHEKKLLNVKHMFWFSLQSLSESFVILRRIKRNIIINVHTSPC